MSTEPIVPRDLKPGDRLWYSETEYAKVKYSNAGSYFTRSETERRRGLIIAEVCNLYRHGTQLMNYWCDTGEEITGYTAPIMRVERMATESQRDAEWLRDWAEVFPAHATRFLAIAKRLEGVKL